MATTKKVETVKELSEKIAKTKSIIFTDYHGLKHKQLEELRNSLRQVESEFVVIKNRLFKRALGDQKFDESHLTLQTAALFNYKDEIAGLKTMLKFFKAAGVGVVKGGILGQNVLSDKEVEKLSTLPNKEQLLGKLVGQLNAPIQGLHYALSWNINKLVWALEAVKSKKV